MRHVRDALHLDALPGAPMTRVGIYASTVCGLDAYYAECLECGWRCHRQPHERQAQAVKCGQRHACRGR